MNRIRLLLVPALIAVAFAPSSADAGACDIPLISQQVAVPPNVMIIMDSSGSMTQIMESDDYDGSVTWSGKFNRNTGYTINESRLFSPADWDSAWGTTPSAPLVSAANGLAARYQGNYLNWIFFHATDEERAAIPQATRQDVQNAAVRYIMNNTANMRFGITRFNGGNGGTIVAEVGEDLGSLETEVDVMRAEGVTPLGETLYDVYEYFRDTARSPIEVECQRNFVIMLTDGQPNQDTSFPDHINDENNNGYLDDVARFVANEDLRSDLDGEQSMEIYTIGFGINDPLLELTAQNGRGFFREAWDLDTLVFELGTVLGDIVTRISSGAAVAVVSTESGDDSYLYRGKFMPGLWRGFLEAFELPFEDGDPPVWEAGAKLRSRDPDSRVIFTSFNEQIVEFDVSNLDVLRYGIAPDGPGSGDVDDGFGIENEDNVFNAADQTLGTNYDEEYVKNVIEYVRGHEVDGFRDREGWKLGDIVYSTPVIVGSPRAATLDPDFQDFLVANMNRERVVYVGANDGMLHAFHAETGEELWAYVPQNVLGSLEQLAKPDYCRRSYVDLSPTAVDVEVSEGNWRTILVCGLRKGGDAYFALDVTDPYSPKVMWETQISDMVNSFTDPVVIDTPSGPVMWAGSGPNVLGYAVAHAIAMDTGNIAGYAWFDFGTDLNAATAPAPIDIDNDGIVDVVYQADLQGDVYRFDLNDPYWAFTKLYDGTPDQPIQSRPSLVRDEDGAINVMFGTGRYLVASDPTTTDQQYFNVVRDFGTGQTFGPGNLASVAATNVDEVQGPGWRFPLSNRAGERVTEPAIAVEGVIYFTSFAPSDEECASGGYSYLYAVDYRTGGNVDRDGDGDVTDESRSESIGEGVASRAVVDMAGENLIVQTSDARLSVSDLAVSPQRILVRGWRESYDQ